MPPSEFKAHLRPRTVRSPSLTWRSWRRGDYLTAHPSSAHLIIEVADSSLPIDHGLKAKLYAESGVEEYWVVNLVDGLIEVHTEIVGGTYVRITPARRGDLLHLVRFPDVILRADDILP